MNYKYDEIGEILRKRRTELGKTTTAVAEETRVLEKYIIAIEAGDIKEFASVVYYDLFARSYARELGFDDKELFEQESIVEEVPRNGLTPMGPQPATISAAPEKNASPSGTRSSMASLIWFGAVIVIGTVAILYVIFNGKSPEDNPAPEKAMEQVIVDSSSVIDEFAADTAAIDSSQYPMLLESLPLRMKIKALQTCWLLIVADKDTVIFGNQSPGAVREITADEKFIISAGNPGGLEITLNDTILKPLAPGGRPLRGLEINRGNKSDFYQISKDSSLGRN
jgi:transcriptional regulator with XRE-family HTH domain